MLKVFLVDDEIVIREGIRNNVRWDEHGLTLCGEAPDSEIALSVIQEVKPDILVTDIRMPFMDGLELCRRVTSTMPWVHVVILSGHDDFAYAQEAISLGVKEYLLKPVSAHALEQVLLRIAANIEQERAQQADVNALKRQLDSSSRLLQQSCLMSLLEGADEQDVLQQARKLRMNLLANHYLVMLVSVAGGQFLQVRAVMERFADGYGGAVHLCVRGGRMAALVMGDTVADLEERAYAFAQAIKHEAERGGDVGLRVSIGVPVHRLAALGQSLASATSLMPATDGRNQIMGATDGKYFHGGVPPELMQLNLLPLYEQLQYADADSATAVIQGYLQPLGSALAQSPLMTNYVIVDMLLAASRIVRQCGCDPADVLPETLQVHTLLGEIRSVQDILDRVGGLLARALACRDKHSPLRRSAAVRKACQYIEANYQNPAIMLRDVAEHVALSNNHFCTVFSQEMGSTFIEYITLLRMEKAQAFLKGTDLSSSEIAEQIGYNDTHYFRYLFKKHTGMNPRDYRAAHRKGTP
ncbi:MAG: response regulator [Oscillospiraceae bacterium]|nr:response regulator [Oscillospiraceae bacterium]